MGGVDKKISSIDQKRKTPQTDIKEIVKPEISKKERREANKRGWGN